MKIPLKAFIIIYPDSPYPKSDDIKIGGVASSSQSEKANEENGIVVPLVGEYDLNQLKNALKERIEDTALTISYYIERSSSKGSENKQFSKMILELKDSMKSYKEQLKKLEQMKVSDLTNLSHFTKDELDDSSETKKIIKNLINQGLYKNEKEVIEAAILLLHKKEKGS